MTTRSGRAGWVGLCALLALAALAGRAVDPALLDWQPARALAQPWRAWTAVGVHYSGLHLAGNLVGVLLVGALGWVAEVPPRAVAAWAIAWPATHAALAIDPALQHYGGLSGVLHAGVAVVGVVLVLQPGQSRAWRRIGVALLAGLVVKVLLEAPWRTPPLRQVQGYDFAVAPLAHASGLAAGVLLGALLLAGLRHLKPAGTP
jgi:rhomboid family GlyGly-CTERM serine protease